jgi:heptosyltransferase-2/heptosyltransferase-3
MPHAMIVLCGAPQEGDMLREIEAAAGLQAVAVAELALRPLLALCEAAHSMISVDTGPAHAAAALGLPLLVMYGAESPGDWLPRSPDGSPVVSVGGPPDATRVDEISVDAVFDAWTRLAHLVPARTTQSSVATASHDSLAPAKSNNIVGVR